VKPNLQAESLLEANAKSQQFVSCGMQSSTIYYKLMREIKTFPSLSPV
jgi:hypothetical protein